MSNELKGHTHCQKDKECSSDKCDYWAACMKIRAHHMSGEILGFDGKWRKATEKDIRQYTETFGEEWVEEFLEEAPE